MFNQCDEDHNGVIDIEEFIHKFIERRENLNTERDNLRARIFATNKTIEEYRKLALASNKNTIGNRVGGVLEFTVANGQNFEPNQRVFVQLQCGNDSRSSAEAVGPNPQWPRQKQTMSLNNDQAPVMVFCVDADTNQPLIQASINPQSYVNPGTQFLVFSQDQSDPRSP